MHFQMETSEIQSQRVHAGVPGDSHRPQAQLELSARRVLRLLHHVRRLRLCSVW